MAPTLLTVDVALRDTAWSNHVHRSSVVPEGSEITRERVLQETTLLFSPTTHASNFGPNMSWILNPEGDGGGRRLRQRPAKLNDLPSGLPSNGAPGTPGKGPKTPGSAASQPGSPWAEFPMKDNYPKVPDPAEEDREVSTKQANRPFLG
jgi:hypothetical protein